jgi:hypothetical protein
MPSPATSDSLLVRTRAAIANAGRFATASPRHKLTTAGVTVAIALAVSITVAGVSHTNAQAAMAAAQEAATAEAQAQAKAQAQAQAKAAAAAKAAREKAAARLRADIISAGKSLAAQAITAAAASASFADPTHLAELDAVRSALETALSAGDVAAISAGLVPVQAAIDSLGTLEDGQDRAYLAAPPSHARGLFGDASAISSARAYCQDLDRQYGDDVVASMARFEADWNKSNADLPGIQTYCPKYLPGIDAALHHVAPGKYSVAESASSFGVAPRTIAAGTYSIPRASGCYWARSTSSGDIIDNDFLSNAPGTVTVTVHSGEGFETDGCATWVKQ